jgi:spore maturation protein CgeB
MRNHLSRIRTDEGRKKGYESGWSDGWRIGACQAIDRLIQPIVYERIQARIMYVPQGFEAIDEGVIDALRSETAEVHVVPAVQMRDQATLLRPDLVLVMNGLHVVPPDHLEQIDAIRRLGIATAIWFVDDPYVTDHTVSIAPHYDYVFTHERSCLELYRSLGIKQLHHLPLAVHFGLFHPEHVPFEYRSDICFIGMAFWNRVQLFDELAPYLKDKKVIIGGGLWERMTRYSQVSNFVRDGWIPVPETAKYYNGAKMVINLHRTTEAGKDNLNGINWPAESVNPRTFEMAACGTLQLTDARSELPEHYRDGAEIAVYRDARHLIQLMEHYLTHDEERLHVAARGYKRTKRDHHFPNRIRKLLDIIGLR